MSLKADIAKMQKEQKEFLRKALADGKTPPTLEDLLKKRKGNSAPAETPK